MAKVGYIRVSTAEQNTARQFTAFEELGIKKIFSEKISGKDMNRPQLKACLDYLREGDTLYVNEYSRLARSTRDLLNIADDLDKKGVTLVSLKEKLDTSTPQGRFMLTVFAGIDQFERELMLQRQREGIAEAKAAGKYKGRKAIAKPPKWLDWYNEYVANKMTFAQLKAATGISRALLYKWIDEEKKKPLDRRGRQKTPRPQNWGKVYELYRTKQIKASEAMKQLGLKKSTFYLLKAEYEAEKGATQ